jgi:ATP/ADP translocase/SOS response regulatory protein OraA/RecX
VFDLLKIQLFIGIAHSFTNIAAFTYFIYKFSIDGLPYAYLAVAGALLFMNIFYEKMERSFSPLKLLKLIVLISAAVLFLFWTGFLLWNDTTIIFLLLVWSVLFYMITGYAYWGLVSLLFNVRESKRVFSIVGAGDIPAKLIGYLSAQFLIPLIGLNHLLAFALVSLGFGLYLIGDLIKKEKAGRFHVKHHAHGHAHIHEQTNQPKAFSLKNNFFFKHKLIFTISLLSLLCYNVFNLIDFTFIAHIKARYHDLSELASFIAIFFAVGRLAALVMKLVFTSRVIEKVGVVACLLITPTVLFIFSIAFLGFDDRSNYSLYFFGIMALFTEVLRSTIQEPSFFILFQPLNEHYRLKGHIIAKGYMLAPSLLIVGASLIIMRNMNVDVNILFTIKILLVNLCLWGIIIYFIKKEYIKTLHQSIARGVFNGEDIHIYDQRTMDILLTKVNNEKETENIYALRLLETGGYEKLTDLFKNFLQTNKPEVKRYALHRLEERNELNAPLLRELLEKETDENVKEQIVSFLCRLDPDYLRSIAAHISELDFHLRKNAIIHLLNQSEFDYLYKAGSEINNLIRSQVAAERGLALEIIGELKNIKFTDAIEKLIEDEDSNVKRNALIAACKLRNKNLLPFIFNMLAEPSNKYLVLQGLFQYGDKLFEDIDILSSEQIEAHIGDLIKIAGRAKGGHSTRFLLTLLKDGSHHEKIIHALWSKGFEAEKVETIYDFQNLLNAYLKEGIEKTDLYFNISNKPSHELIRNSIYGEIKNDVVTVLKTCAILYHKKEINRILELIENSDQKRIFNAMEMMELVLPKKISSQINELVDFTLDPVTTKRKLPSSVKNNFFELVMQPKTSFTPWTKAVCLYTTFKNQEFNLLKNIKVDNNDSPVLYETKNYVLNAAQQSVYADY